MRNHIVKTCRIAGMLLLAIFAFYGCLPPDEPEPCDPPTNLEVIQVGTNSIGISWDAMPGVDSFQVSVSPNSVPGGPFVTQNNFFTINGLQPNTLYKIEVRSFCSGTSLSEPALVVCRTQSIIIIDLISQLSGPQQSSVTAICDGLVTAPNTKDWNNQFADELLRLQAKDGNNTVLADVGILKQYDAATGLSHFYIPRIGFGCNNLFTVVNAPPSANSSALSTVVLNGNGYIIELTATQAIMTWTGTAQTQPVNITYTMNR